MVDALDLKSNDKFLSCRFESGPRHQMERYLRKHIYQAGLWAQEAGSSEEAAQGLVKSWNERTRFSYAEELTKYPETPGFISAVARLIALTRDGEEINQADSRRDDTLCQACDNCLRYL